MTNIDINSITEDFEQPVKSEGDEIKELLVTAQINTDVHIHKAPSLLSVIDSMNDVDIFTEGNISVIKGKAKARKSFATAMILAGYLNKNGLYETFKPNTTKNCILFDTEQSSYYVQQTMYRIRTMSDDSYSKRFYGFCLRPYTPDVRLKMIEYIIENMDNLGLIVIDGIRDLIKDVNNADEATHISSKLLKWTENTGCHILNVIHENNQDGRSRGHLGTELTNKAETILKVEKSADQPVYSYIKAEMMRGIDFNDICFTIENNIPIVVA